MDYNGRKLTYPDIKLVYWAGSNHLNQAQYTNRVIVAWQRPEVTIVHDYAWTPTARHADIVLPATTTLERNDLLGTDRFIMAMQQLVPPLFESRTTSTSAPGWPSASALARSTPRARTRWRGCGSSTGRPSSRPSSAG